VTELLTAPVALPPATAAQGPLLVIGYGSSLHGDDALGPRIAEAVAGWDEPGIRALARHELLPELAADIAAAGRVIFVDADPAANAVTLTPLVGTPAGGGLGHALTPLGLLSLAAAAYGRRPPASLLAVPGENFGLGDPLSERAGRAELSALAFLRSAR
jgi:hydrogenase maturation protease